MRVLIRGTIFEIDAIARLNDVVTVDTALSHGYSTDDWVFIDGVTSATDNFNGKFQITVTDTDTFTYDQVGDADESGDHGNVYKYGAFPDDIEGGVTITQELDVVSRFLFNVRDPDNTLLPTYRNHHNKWIEVWKNSYDQSTDKPLFRGFIFDIVSKKHKLYFLVSGHEGALNLAPSGYDCTKMKGKLDGAPTDGGGGGGNRARFDIEAGWTGAWTTDDQYTSANYAMVTDAGTSQTETEHTHVPGDEGIIAGTIELRPKIFLPLYLGKSIGGIAHTVLLRFTVNLPRNIDQVTRAITKCTIQTANLKLRVIIAAVGAFTGKIRLIPMDNCPPFKENVTTILDLTNTTDEVDINIGGEAANAEKSVDIAALVNQYIARFDNVGGDNKDPYRSWYKMGIVLTIGDAAPNEFIGFYSKFDAAIWQWGSAAPHIDYTYTYPKFQKSYSPIEDDDYTDPWIKTQDTDTPATDGVNDQDIIRVGIRHDKAVEEIANTVNENILVSSANIKDSTKFSIQDYSSSPPWKAVKNIALKIGVAGSYCWVDADRELHVDDSFTEYTTAKIEESTEMNDDWIIDRSSKHLISKVIVRGNRERGAIQEYGRIEETDQPLPVLEFKDDNIISSQEAYDLAKALFERFYYIPPSLHGTIRGYEDLQIGMSVETKFHGLELVDIASEFEDGAKRDTNVVTITTREPHLFKAADTVTIAGVSIGANTFNGDHTIVATPTTTTLTYNQNGADETEGGGTAAAYRWLVVRKMERQQDPGAPMMVTLSLGLGKSTPEETFANRLSAIVSELKDRTTPDDVVAEGQWTEGAGGASMFGFKTINCPAGTDPVAENSADVLNLTAGGDIVITGNSATDTVDIALTKYTDAQARAVSIENVVEDTTPQLGGNLDCNAKTITGCTQITDSGTHLRTMNIQAVPDDNYTSGVNNCWWNVGANYGVAAVQFGQNAKTQGSMVGFDLRLPSDYKDGEDIYMDISWGTAHTTGTDVTDYKLRVWYETDAGTFTLDQTIDSTWTGATNYVANFETITISGTNLTAGMKLNLEYYQEDDGNTHGNYLWSWSIRIPVDEYD